jgi:poly-gamma-glutamate synthesis protein (capsule biosynthesis protein)
MNQGVPEPFGAAKSHEDSGGTSPGQESMVNLFLSGDVMLGRGIDQILPYPSDPALHETFVKSAQGYVDLAERSNGPIPRRAAFDYVWGDALQELKRVEPHVRIVNLETAVTKSEAYQESKAVHYRMNPENVPCLSAAGIDCCTLANNHAMDWGEKGLAETLRTLKNAGRQPAGAGQNLREAQTPAVFDVSGRGRVLVFAFGSASSGIPPAWAANDKNAGVNLLDEDSPTAALQVQVLVEHVKRKGDVVVASIHWGANWGFEIPRQQRDLAHELIDHAWVDVVHGHSSHHVKGLEVYRGKPILYGCGDFLTDYEGISGYERFRGNLGLMYFVGLDPATGRLAKLQMTATTVRRFQVKRASQDDRQWLLEVLNREGRSLGTRVVLDESDRLIVHWD